MRTDKTVIEIIEEVKELMKQAGYLEETIRRYNFCWNAFLEFSDGNKKFFF